MKKQNGSALITALLSVGVLVVLGVFFFLTYVSNYNLGNRYEATLKAEYQNMENVLAQYSLKVAEVAQVPDVMKADLIEVNRAALEGRYGENGSQAVFQWIQENYAGTVDPQVYRQIQQVMEAGRNEFQNTQTKFIDIKRQYETDLGYFWRGFWLRLAGYPKKPLDEWKVISSEHAQEAFKTGIDQGVKIR